MNKLKHLLAAIYRWFFPITLVEMYKRMGVKIGENCQFQFGVTIDYSHHWLVQIGNDVILAPKVHILTHDASTKMHLGYSRIANVIIEDKVFVGANTIILPGVKIGKNAIVGAGSVVTKSIPENSVYAGNPAKMICTTFDYLKTKKQQMLDLPKYDKTWTLNKISSKQKVQMFNELEEHGGGFVD